jgi:hypothetical protein
MASYTIKNLKESEDVAVRGGVSEMRIAAFSTCFPRGPRNQHLMSARGQ